MAFVNLSLLLGGAFIAIPVVLHLVMRQQPKQLQFPAIRFLKQKRETNRRKLQLRHWLLLALRCGAILMIAAALARPSVASTAFGNWLLVGLVGFFLVASLVLLTASIWQRRGKILLGGLAGIAIVLFFVFVLLFAHTLRDSGQALIGDREAPVAATLIVDTSPRMAYRHENRTRLEVAQETAQWILKKLPEGSEVSVIDTHPGAPYFAVDLTAATKSIERLHATGSSLSLPSVMSQALKLLLTSSKARKEMYVVTDLTRVSWDDHASFANEIRDAQSVQLYVVDVGIAAPRNVGIRDLHLSSELVPQGGEVNLQAEIAATGSSSAKTVELVIEEPDPTRPLWQDGRLLLPNQRVRGQQIGRVEPNQSTTLDFSIRGLELGVHHGLVRLIGEDGLPDDDVRYFTLEVKSAWPVLVLSPPEVTTKFLVEAIAPYEWRQTGRALFECQVGALSTLANRSLGDFGAVFILDPTPLTPGDWQRLEQYVSNGGGLGIFLGHNAHPKSFNETAAQQILGGVLARQWRSSTGDLFLAPQRFDHPILSAFRNRIVPWNQFPTYRHWVLDPVADSSRVIATYGNNKPAIIQRQLGSGRIVVMTTPVSESSDPQGRDPWNELATGEDPWPFVVLMDQMARYLVSSGENRLNYIAGETAALSQNPERDPEKYQLFTPQSEPLDVSARDDRLNIRFTDNPGHYRLKGFRGGPVARGFAVNIPQHATDLARIDPQKLDGILGARRYELASTLQDIDRGIGEARVGREFYEYFVIGLAVLLCLELLLANRFYKKEQSLATVSPKTIAAEWKAATT